MKELIDVEVWRCRERGFYYKAAEILCPVAMVPRIGEYLILTNEMTKISDRITDIQWHYNLAGDGVECFVQIYLGEPNEPGR